MKKIHLLFAFLTLNLFLVNNIKADIITPKTDGDWNVTTTWNGEIVPSATDSVSIDGFTITINSNVTVKRIFLTNQSNSNTSQLIVEGTDTLTVTEDIVAVAVNKAEEVKVHIRGEAVVFVQGNVDFSRTSDNNTNKFCRFHLDGQSQTFIEGDFIYDYKNGNTDHSSTSNNFAQIYTSAGAQLEVFGKTTLYVRAGADLDFFLEDSSKVLLYDSLKILLTGGEEAAITSNHTAHLQLFSHAYLLNSGGTNHCKLKSGDAGGKITITGNLTMETTNDQVGDWDIKLEVKSATSEFHIEGDIIMNAADQEEVIIHLRDGGKLYFGGNLTRQTAFGSMTMENGGELIFNGSTPQIIPKTKLASSGTDSLHYGEVRFENTAGLTLSGDMVVRDTLFLTTGNVVTHDTALIIVEEDAIISGGSKNAFVDGPILKRGSTNNQPFLFPVGDSLTYAPVEISKVSDNNAEYTARLYGDPPPFGEIYGTGVNHISDQQYWTITKKTGSPDVGITLHWMDPAKLGINDLDSLLVVGLSATNVWESYGNGGTDGSTGVDEPGSVTTLGDPPPFGIIKFTIGTTSPANTLPVELTKFQAIQQIDKVYLEWETATEINSSRFIVEHSLDGVDFETLTTVASRGNTNENQRYSTFDFSPYYGFNYYRLKIVDMDGTFEYSHIEVVEYKISPTFRIFPNPVKEVLQIEGDTNGDFNVIEVYDNKGQLLSIGNVSFENGILKVSTDAINVSTPGTYFLRIKGKSASQIIKFIKVE